MNKQDLEELELMAEGLCKDAGIFLLRETNKRGHIWKFYDAGNGMVIGFWCPETEWGSFGREGGEGETMGLGKAFERAVARQKELRNRT